MKSMVSTEPFQATIALIRNAIVLGNGGERNGGNNGRGRGKEMVVMGRGDGDRAD